MVTINLKGLIFGVYCLGQLGRWYTQGLIRNFLFTASLSIFVQGGYQLIGFIFAKDRFSVSLQYDVPPGLILLMDTTCLSKGGLIIEGYSR